MSSNSVNKSVTSSSLLTSSASSSPPVSHPRYYEKFKCAKALAENAMRENRIFTIVGKYPLIRSALRKRGWVEKTYSGDIPSRLKRRRRRQVKNFSDLVGSDLVGSDLVGSDFVGSDLVGSDLARIILASDDNFASDPYADYSRKLFDVANGVIYTPNDIDDFNYDDDLSEGEDINTIMSRMVRKSTPNFIWTCRRDCIYFKRIRKNQLVNHFPTADFTTKIGLCHCLQDLRWHVQVDVRSFFPRCYCIGIEEEKLAFIEDYRLTACMGILKWVINFVQTTKSTNVNLPLNCMRVPLRVAEFALQQCDIYLKIKNHEDIDYVVNIPMSDEQWNVILDWYYQLVHKNALMVSADIVHDKCVRMLKKMRPYWPQMELDGMHNVWIVKPGAKSRGIGIMILEKLDDIINLIDSQVVVKTTKYVVQKYIERPFLIYNTKFDIRQWFMVTDWNPLTIYFYKDCYLRFCSRYFSLKDKSEAVHLCNNAVQRRYMHEERPSVLPKYAMWSSDEFKEFLKKKGKSLIWDKVIYPGMKEAVTATMIAAQEFTENKKGCFELYGADFMLTENFRPWLLEINSSPCLAPTTQVTAKLCANVLEDTVKVLIDRRQNKNADIGQFEMAFRQAPLPLPPYIGINLYVQGTSIARPQNVKLKEENSLEICQIEAQEFKRSKPRKAKRKSKIQRDKFCDSICGTRFRLSDSTCLLPSSEDRGVIFIRHQLPRSDHRSVSHGSLHIEQLYSENESRKFSAESIKKANSKTSGLKRKASCKRDLTTKREEFPTLNFITLSPWHSSPSNTEANNWNPYMWYQLPSTIQNYLQDLDKKRLRNARHCANTNRKNNSKSFSPYSLDSNNLDNHHIDASSGPHIVPMTY